LNNHVKCLLVPVLILVVCTCNSLFAINADLSRNGSVDMEDLVLFAQQWLTSDCAEPNWCSGADFNLSHNVDFHDFSYISQNWGKGIKLEMATAELLIRNNDQILNVLLNCPEIAFNIGIFGGQSEPVAINGDIQSGEPVEVLFPLIEIDNLSTLEVKLFIQWFQEESVLREWVKFRINGECSPVTLNELLLKQINTAGKSAEQFRSGYVDSYPVFMNGFFIGTEFPISATRLEGNTLILSQRPGLEVEPGVWYQNHKTVYGVTEPGQEKKVFSQYIQNHRPQPTAIHLNYNSWWTLPHPYTQADVLALMTTFKEKLYDKYGVSFDSFAIDMGWSNPYSIWEIDAGLFPQGFTQVQAMVQSMNSKLGLWISPSAVYGGALNNDWARENGYEVTSVPWGTGQLQLCCLGGENYSTRFRDRLIDMVGSYGISQIKLDGYFPYCYETNHGHVPGVASADKIADGAIAAFDAVRDINPNVWLETTCFGFNSSPWWLFYVNSAIGVYGDDSPPGCVPAPLYRESATTGRDYFNLQGAYWLVKPISSQEVLGIIHQTPDAFQNDAVTVIMRGNAFISMYINPVYMNQSRWQDLAGIMTWARNNYGIIQNTSPILPLSWKNGEVPKLSYDYVMPREIYGYSHVVDGNGLLHLRNPWIAPQTISLKLDDQIGFSTDNSNMSVVSLYPEVRLYGQNLNYGDGLSILVEPYETLVLSINGHQSVEGVPNASDLIGGKINVDMLNEQVNYINGGMNVQVEINVTLNNSEGELVVFLEDKDKSPAEPSGQIRINGVNATWESSASDNGWASSHGLEQDYWRVLKVPLQTGVDQVSINILSANDCSNISFSVWASKQGGIDSNYPNALPSPEQISLDGLLIGNYYREQASLPQPTDGLLGVDPCSITLSWVSGHSTMTHHVYLGTNYNAVVNADISSDEYKISLPSDTTTYTPDELESNKTYYWRIDELKGDEVWRGEVWSFTTHGIIIDPYLVGWWKFDEISGNVAMDSSGYGYNGIVSGATRVDGQTGGKALDFEGAAYVTVPASTLSSLDKQVTITLWQYGDVALQPQIDYIFNAADSFGNRIISVHLPWSDGTVYWDAGDNSGFDRISKAAGASQYEGKWNHWAFVKNADTGSMKIYLNGVLWQSGTGKTKALGTATAFKIGSSSGGTLNYDGIIDDVRIFDRELDALFIQDIYLGKY